MQLMDEVTPAEKQTRPNAERLFEMEIEDEYPDEVNEPHKDYENQETNQNPHLQPDRSMILKNTNETITPFATANLDAISDALVDAISKDNPNFNDIEDLLQSAREVQNPGHSVNGFTNVDDVIDFVLEVANDLGLDDIISRIDSWRYSQGK